MLVFMQTNYKVQDITFTFVIVDLKQLNKVSNSTYK